MNKEDMLDQAVIGLFDKPHSGFFATIYAGLNKIWNDPNVPTAAVDGTNLYINEDFFRNELSRDGRVTVLAHEIAHVSLFHVDPARRGNRDPKKWNWACDYAINIMLKDHDFVFDMDCLLDEKYRDMSAEQIYDLLPDDELPNDIGSDILSSDKTGEEMEEEIKKVQDLVLTAHKIYEMSSSSNQNLPNAFRQVIEKLLYPKLPWGVLLKRWFNEKANSKYTWSVRNRRFPNVYMPSRQKDNGLDHIMWAFDVSLSMGDEQLHACFSEMHGVRELYNPDRMTVITFDTDIRQIMNVTPETNTSSITLEWRGGTDMEPVVQKAKKDKATLLVIFSDMECYVPSDPGIPVLFVAVDADYMDPEWKTMEYGKIIHLSTKQ